MTAELSARLKASGTLCRTCRGRGRASPLCSSIRGDILPQRCPRRWLKKKIAGLVEHCSDPGGDVLRWKQNSAARRAARVTAQRCCKVATRAVCPPGHEQSAACSLCAVKREPYLEKIVSSERPRSRSERGKVAQAVPQIGPISGTARRGPAGSAFARADGSTLRCNCTFLQTFSSDILSASI